MKKNLNSQTLCVGPEKFFGRESFLPPIIMNVVTQPANIENFNQLVATYKDYDGDYPFVMYARSTSSPTIRFLERKLAKLEGTEDCVILPSGLSAIAQTFFSLLKTNDVVVANNVYSESKLLLKSLKKKYKIKVTFIDTVNSLANLHKFCLRSKPKIIFIETPSVPLLELTDIEDCSKIAKKYQAVLVVDNSVLSSVGQKPSQLGADLVVCSLSKHTNGSGDTLGGAVLGRKEQLAKIRESIELTGSIISPFNAWLIVKGLKTLPLRLEYQAKNAKKLAEHFVCHPLVEKLIYPGLENYPQKALVKKQMLNNGNLLIFQLKQKYNDKIMKFLKSLTLPNFAWTFGNSETTLIHYGTILKGLPHDKERDGIIRVSVGLENVKDLIADFDQALNCIKF